MNRLKITLAAAVMTCGASSPTVPKYDKPAPTEQDSAVTTARDNERRRRRSTASNTFLTSGISSSSVTTGTKTLLGQ